MSTKLAGVALAFVDLCLAEVASKTWVTVAGERVLSIDTLPPMTRGTLAVIYVCFTVGTCEAWWTLACVDSNGVVTDATISTRVALTVIDVNLTAVTSETNCTRAAKCVDQIVAYTPIQTRIQLALVDVNLTLCAREARHADAAEGAWVIQAGAIILAWV